MECRKLSALEFFAPVSAHQVAQNGFWPARALMKQGNKAGAVGMQVQFPSNGNGYVVPAIPVIPGRIGGSSTVCGISDPIARQASSTGKGSGCGVVFVLRDSPDITRIHQTSEPDSYAKIGF